MDANAVLVLLLALVTKHFVFDFPLQTPYQYLNKGTYGHPGGLLHSGLHGFATAVILILLSPRGSLTVMWLLGLLEFVIHYHTDWAKVRINARYGWSCSSSSEFWVLLGVDQYIHSLTYIAIAYLATKYV